MFVSTCRRQQMPSSVAPSCACGAADLYARRTVVSGGAKSSQSQAGFVEKLPRFATALGQARNSDVFKAGLDFHGVHDGSVFFSERPYFVAAISSTIASPTSDVVAFPPRSGVRTSDRNKTRSTAFSTSWAAVVSPRCSSIIAPDQI